VKSLALLVCFSAIARAQPPPEPPERGEPAYRMQTLLVDVTAIGIVYAGLRTDLPLVGLGALTYILGAPAVHAHHGHGARAAASLAIRCTLPVLAFIALAQGSGDEVPPFAIPGVAGMLAASVLDAAFLARGTPTRPRIVPVITPSSQPSQTALTFGFAAQF
jgi:hypothetical protein